MLQRTTVVRAWTQAHQCPDASRVRCQPCHLSVVNYHGLDAQHTVCADPVHASRQVELPWRALLPPGVDDLVLAIHDDEPTSIVAYFLATR